ncbi:Aste57867_22186 [Aphanomyces stellatus]|uniref:Aste57867_22186 protein n=1 Tax=Aphanomyces stellatus TaxID=120398 RepID=A0A485LPG1_9STRA|nr:hypothetical protein As57867_022117 [Aphanomyces stellatus]VFT98853.1 Aste57867_22186 [Aphanomyces stellatus]
MTSPGKRQRESLDVLGADGQLREEIGDCAPPAKSPNLGTKDGGPNGQRQASKMNRFGFGSGLQQPKSIKSTSITQGNVAQDDLSNNQDENDNKNIMAVATVVETSGTAAATKQPSPLALKLDESTTKNASKPVSVSKAQSGARPGSVPKPTSVPKPRTRVLPQPRPIVKPRSGAVRRTTIPPVSTKQKESTGGDDETSTSAPPAPSPPKASSFVALLKDKMSVISHIDDAVKPKRSKVKAHDWRGKFEEQKTMLSDMRTLLRRVVDEAKQLEQDAFKLDQTLAMDRCVLEREVNAARDRTHQVDAVTHEIQSDFNEMQVRYRLLKGEHDRLADELAESRAQKQGVSELQMQLTDAVAHADMLKLESEREIAALAADNKALAARVETLTQDHASAKASLSRKDDEVSTMFASLRQMQDFATSANGKLEADNQTLRDKLAAIEAQGKELETKYTEASTSLRHVEAELQTCRAAKDDAVAQVAEKTELWHRVTNEMHEQTRLASVEKELRVLIDSQMRELRVEQLATNAQMEAVKAEMKHMQERHADKLKEATAQLEALQAEMAAAAAAHAADVDALRESNVSLESELHTWRSKQKEEAMVEMTALVDAKREADVLRLRLKEQNLHGMQSMEEKDRLLAELQAKVKEGEIQRRKMHNTIQELRGNVRVFARTRPFLPSDGTDGVASAVACDVDLQRVTLKREKESHAFTFDRVFSPVTGQDAVFEEVSEFVQSAIDGYQVCLFSYGQTGSGKTHTMQGSGTGQMRGIIPRSIEKIMSECDKSQEQGWRYVLHASFLEIYNETVRDLLAEKADLDKKLVLKMDPKGGVSVVDLTLVPITSLGQVEGLMEKAARVRSVACTDMNAQSSRSHSVFSLHLRGVNDTQGTVLEGKLNLVDLAGSERLARSNATGSRLKEAQAINKSLSCLTDVFAAIGNKGPHIPFRNSKLTYLLQSCLSGDGKTLMMVNLSPTVDSAHESLCSLRFAQHVNQCELGKPKRQLKKKGDEDMS